MARPSWAAAASARGSAFASGGYGWNRRALTVSAGTSRTDRYLDPPTTSNASNTGTLGGISVSFDQHVTPRDRIQMGWRHSQASFLVPNDLEQEEAGQRQDRSTHEHSGQIAWSHVFSPRLLLNVRAAGTRLSADLWSNAQAVPVVVFQQRGFNRGYMNASISAEAGRHEIKIGGDLLHAPVREALQYHISDRSFFDEGTAVDFTFADQQTDREQACSRRTRSASATSPRAPACAGIAMPSSWTTRRSAHGWASRGTGPGPISSCAPRTTGPFRRRPWKTCCSPARIRWIR
jgi:hypothetical protein